jgi:hypothetical protein
MGAALVVTVLTGGDYVVRAVRLRRAVPGHQAGGAASGESLTGRHIGSGQ